MTEAIQNNIQTNAQTMPQRPQVGLLTPPNVSTRPNLIPQSAPKRMLTQVNHDLYDKNKELNINDTVQTPAGVKILFGLVGIGLAALGAKKLWKKLPEIFKHKA